MKTVRRKCKRCPVEFEQTTITRPREYCGYRCKSAARREVNARLAKTRWDALRAAGYSAAEAQPASVSKWRFEALMRAAQEGRANVAAE